MSKSAMNRRDFALLLAATAPGAALLGGLAACSKKESAPSATTGASGPSAATAPVAGIDYKVLKQPAPTEATPGKVELIAFFGYWCPHCYAFSRKLEDWHQHAPAEITYHAMPVSFGNAAHEPLQRMYFALRDIGKLDAMHFKLFEAVQKERLPLFTNEALLDWASKQPELAGSGFAQAFDSFGMGAQINKANTLTKAYELDGVPSFGVAGKYYCDGTMAKSLDRSLQIAAALALKEAKSSTG